MPLASQLKPEDRVMSLFVGESGSGKSCAAAFAPKKIKWMALTKRVYGIMGHPIVKNAEWLKDIDITFYDAKKGFKAMDDDLEILLMKGHNLGYKTVVFEDFTTASDLLQDDAFQFTGLLKGKDGQSASWHKKFGNIDLPGLDEFAYEDKAFKDITLALNALPCNVICMVHWTDKYIDNKIAGRKISLRNATIPKVVKWFNEVWYFEKGVRATVIDKRTIQLPFYTVSFNNDLARTSFPGLKKLGDVDWTDKDFWSVVQPYIQLEGNPVKVEVK